MQMGREILYTDYPEITSENVLDVLRDVFAKHTQNATRMQFLIDYDKGKQPLRRKKMTRTDIDCQCVDNVANEATEFWCGYSFGSPITLVQNGDGKEEWKSGAISELNKNYEMAKIRTKTQEYGRFVVICGICNVLIDVNTDWKEGKSFFTYDVLDPRTSFVVRSSYYTDHRVMLGATYRHDRLTGNNYFTCWTKDRRYEIVNLQEISNGDITNRESWQHSERSGEMNTLGVVPMVEYFRSYDRMGVFERQISEMDNLNLMISDFSNDVDQNTQAIWHGNDIEFPEIIIKNEDGTETKKISKPKTNEWVMTYTSADGKQPFINPLSIDYDYDGMLNNITTRRQLILQKCNVPQRNESSGGSTGVAMSDATGWSQAETAAAKQQMLLDSSKLEEVEIVLAAIRESSFVPQDSNLRKLTIADVEPNIKRQKTYEMTTKVNAMATLLSHGIRGDYVLNGISFFDDPNEVWEGSKELIEKYQSSIFDKTETSIANTGEGGEGEKQPDSDRIMGDLSDQIENSPMIDKSRVDK